MSKSLIRRSNISFRFEYYISWSWDSCFWSITFLTWAFIHKM